ncbi:SNF2 family N-terminal domain-containing protein [Umbelopsis sp. PMI_123]|nr:SNF2 family N-terminal domain-containing protein [Umbelopsis sp. PMI_123]
MNSDSSNGSRKRSRESSPPPTVGSLSDDIDLTKDTWATALGIDPAEIAAQKEQLDQYSKRHRLQIEQDAALARRLHEMINGPSGEVLEPQLQIQSPITEVNAAQHEENEVSSSLPAPESENPSSNAASSPQDVKAESFSLVSSPMLINSDTPVSTASTPTTISSTSTPSLDLDVIDLTAQDEALAKRLQNEELILVENGLIGSSADTPLVISEKSRPSHTSPIANQNHFLYNSYINSLLQGKGNAAKSGTSDSFDKPTEQGYIKLDDDLLMRDGPSTNTSLENGYWQLLQDIYQTRNRASLFSPSSSTSTSQADSRDVAEKRISRDESERELRSLLKTIENDYNINVEDRTGTPDSLIPTLMEHQKKGLSWLINIEEGSNKGGILADDMGLGKTIQMIALILSRPCSNADPIPPVPTLKPFEKERIRQSYTTPRVLDNQDRKAQKRPETLLKTKSTLVVCPVSLIYQWRDEILSKTSPALNVVLYHGPLRDVYPAGLASADVILTSYTVLVSEYGYETSGNGPLYQTRFHRIILDEAHCIKNRKTRSAAACSALHASHRWCLTATPIQNRVSDLYSLIRFLKIKPYHEWSKFSADIDMPLLSNAREHAMKRVQILMKAISLRRTKDGTIDGKPLLVLPARRVHITHVEFSEDERNFYDYVSAKVQAKFSKYLDSGTVMKHYSSVLVMILRLRQACLHPVLTTTNINSGSNETLKEENYKRRAKMMQNVVIQRLIQQKLDENTAECPICMDVTGSPYLITLCGHCFCQECLFNFMNTSSGEMGKDLRCPQCRIRFSDGSLIPVEIFQEVHNPTFKKSESLEIDITVKKPKDFVSSTKIDTMLEILAKTKQESNGTDKTVIFTQFTNMLDLIEEPLKATGYKYVRYDGSLTVKAKNNAVQALRDDPETTIMLTSMKCGSLGLNLTAANRVILLDIWWNPALENQAIDRVHRIGQTKDVDVHRILIKDTIEDKIVELQKKKQAIADSALNPGTTNEFSRLGLNELLLLFRTT